MENKVIKVVGQNHQTFVAKLADMNRRLSKKNLPLINAKLLEEYDCKTKEQVPVPYEPFAIQIDVTYHYYVYELSSEFDQKNIAGVDVQFEGVVDLIDKNENAKVFKLADSNLFKYLSNCECDECHKAIGRNKYIVFSKSGKSVESREDLVVLGTSCAKNYFPFDVVNYIGNVENFYAELFGECDDSMGYGFHSDNYINIRRLFSLVGCVTNDFTVYTKDGGTKGDVELLIKGKTDKNFVYVEPKTKWEDMEEWLKVAYSNPTDEFSANVHGVMFDPDSEEPKLKDDIDLKYLGIACYAFVGAKKAHDKELERLAKEKMYKDSIKDEWFGDVGDKFEKELMFERIIGFEGYYGYTYFVFFRDEEGRVYKWSTGKGTYQCWHKTNGRDAYLEYEVGKKYLIKGSVKEHSEYKGVKQTVITRCKVLKDEYENHVFSPKDVIKEEAPAVEYEDPFESMMGCIA